MAVRGGPLIAFEHVTVLRGGTAVLDDACLEVFEGDYLPVIGANGAGKTTLLRALLGLVPVSSGRIRTPFRKTPPGYVPQAKTLDPLFPVSAREIVEMGLIPRLPFWKGPDREMAAEVEAAIERFGLSGHASKKFQELSGGMRQKCLIARAIVSGADVLVLDEPAAGLDARSCRELFELLSVLNRDDGKTILFSHHGDLAPIATFEKVCLISDGNVRIVPSRETERRGSGGMIR